MKTHNNLWSAIIDFENLYRAYAAAAKGKRFVGSSLAFAENLEENLIIIQNDLIWSMFKPGKLREFWINDPKKRLISAPCFRDRVVHHALVAIIEPLFERRFIYDSHACRQGHGTHLAIARTRGFMRASAREGRDFYLFKGDIKSYFPSIQHAILKRLIRRTIRDRRTLSLIDLFIDGYRVGSRGLPIGALTSQLFANVYLDALDHFAKDHLGLKRYIRYMDDFLVFSKNKKELQATVIDLERFITNELALEMNPKSGILHGRNGVPFCGYRINVNRTRPRRATLARAKRRLKMLARGAAGNAQAFGHFRASLMSFLGYLKQCDAWKTTASALGQLVIKARKERR